MSHSINLPRIMQVGKNARSHLPEILNSLGAKRPLIITDKMMVSLGYIDQIQNLLKAENIESDYFDETIPEPTSASIEARSEERRVGKECRNEREPIDETKYAERRAHGKQ